MPSAGPVSKNQAHDVEKCSLHYGPCQLNVQGAKILECEESDFLCNVRYCYVAPDAECGAPFKYNIRSGDIDQWYCTQPPRQRECDEADEAEVAEFWTSVEEVEGDMVLRESLSAPRLRSISGSITIEGPNIEYIELSSLSIVGGGVIIQNAPDLTWVNFGDLGTTVGNSVMFFNCSSLRNVTWKNLHVSEGDVKVVDCPSLETFASLDARVIKGDVIFDNTMLVTLENVLTKIDAINGLLLISNNDVLQQIGASSLTHAGRITVQANEDLNSIENLASAIQSSSDFTSYLKLWKDFSGLTNRFEENCPSTNCEVFSGIMDENIGVHPDFTNVVIAVNTFRQQVNYHNFIYYSFLKNKKIN